MSVSLERPLIVARPSAPGRLAGWFARAGRSRSAVFLAGLLVIGAAVLLRIDDPAVVARARLLAFDQYQRLLPRPATALPVRVVDIDDETLARLGQWPWPRDLLARLIDRLHELGAASIALDIILAEPDRTSPAQLAERLLGATDDGALRQLLASLPDHDSVLAEAMARASVVTGYSLSPVPNGARPRTAAIATIGDPEFDLGDAFGGAIVSLPKLQAAAAGNGSISIVADRDEVVRRVPVLQTLDGFILPSLAVEALRVAQGASTLKVRFNRDGGTLRVGRVDVPFDHEGKSWLHYREMADDLSVPAWQVLDGTGSADLGIAIAGSVVFIGTSAAGLKDLRTTPLAAFTPGVLVHAQAVEQMLTGSALSRPRWLDGAEILGFSAVALLLLIAFARLSAAWSAVVAIAAIGVAIAGSWAAFTRLGVLVDPVWPAATVAALYVAIITMTYARTERERGYIRRAFGQYMAPALVEVLVEHPERLRLGGELREMTFLFSDIAGFTPFVERTPPELLVELLNAYLDGVCDLVGEHGGTLDKIVGDAVHAIFNAPLDQPDHAARGIACALAIDAFSSRFVEDCAARGIAFGHTRLGVNTGSAVVGNFGGDKRFDYTAHGDSINLAARLEGANKWIGSRICVAESSARRAPSVDFRPLGDLVVVGRTNPVSTFEPLSSGAASSARINDYKAAYRQMAEGRPEATAAFAELARRFPDDAVIAFHAERAAGGERGCAITMTSK